MIQTTTRLEVIPTLSHTPSIKHTKVIRGGYGSCCKLRVTWDKSPRHELGTLAFITAVKEEEEQEKKTSQLINIRMCWE